MQKGGITSKAFTIVELLIVVVVIAILAAVAIVAYNGISNRAKESAALSAISQAVKKVGSYAVLNSEQYPANATVAGLVGDDQTTYEVSSISSPQKDYCVTVKSGNLLYFQTATMSEPYKGTCYGLVAWWPFNGDAQDKTGNSIHGTVNGALLTTGQTGEPNSAYALGQTSQNITVGTPSQFTSLPSGFTYSVWVARTGASTNQWPLVMGASDTHRDFGIRTANFGSTIYFEWGRSPFDGALWAGTGSSGTLNTPNEWHHITITYEGTTLSSYWDGVRTYTSSSAELRPTMNTFSFTTPVNGWMGNIDDARVYNRALSAEEIRAIYHAGAY